MFGINVILCCLFVLVSSGLGGVFLFGYAVFAFFFPPPPPPPPALVMQWQRTIDLVARLMPCLVTPNPEEHP